MPANPDTAKITAELWRFIEACQSLEPADTGTLFPYAHKPGYHDTRAHNDTRAGLGHDYSARSADDRAGPADKCAAFDWISESARTRGDRTIMNRYGRRVREAFRQRDPRLTGWREVLTQVDAGVPEGYDFVGWFTRTPDNTHDWHHHFSILRRHVGNWSTYVGMLSILAGESLAEWAAGRSRYQEGNDEMTPLQQLELRQSRQRSEAALKGQDAKVSPDLHTGSFVEEPNIPARRVAAVEARIAALEASVGTIDYQKLAVALLTEVAKPANG